MIERLLFQVLMAGIRYLMDNPGAISAFFVGDGILEKEEADAIEARFLKDWRARDLTKISESPVVHGFMSEVIEKFPVACITLVSDAESQKFLANEGSMHTEPDPVLGDGDVGSTDFAAIFRYQYAITVYAQHADVAIYYYHLVRQMLINAIPVMQGAPYLLFDISFAGADVAPDPAWVPAGFYARRATFSCQREYTQAMPATQVGLIRSVRGISIDFRGDINGDVGGVPTQVFPVNPDEEKEG